MTKTEEKIRKFYDEINLLEPTLEEMTAFIVLFQNPYGIVTYSTRKKKPGEASYFMSVQDNHKGHKLYHIDLGCVNFNRTDNNVTHLMLDKNWAVRFVDFIKKYRVKLK